MLTTIRECKRKRERERGGKRLKDRCSPLSWLTAEEKKERRREGTKAQPGGGAAAQARDLKREEREKGRNSRRIDLKGGRLHFLR